MAVAALTLQLTPAAVATPSANAGPKSMVALGDSHASGPLIPVQTDQPLGCLRSGNNYANQVARALDLELTDVTCSSATTEDMAGEQTVTPESDLGENGAALGATGATRNPPQLLALESDPDIVTLQIGGNDIGFVDLALTCAEGFIDGRGCRQAVADEKPFVAIEETRPKIAAVLEAIHLAAPHAAIYVLGYAGIFKIGETARCDNMVVEEEDAAYLRSIQEGLNEMIDEVASASGKTYSDATTYVDVYWPSAGHTACDPPAIRWIEPIVPVNAAYPAHPNLGGMTAIAQLLVEKVWPRGLPRRDAPPGLPAPPDSPL
jgi:lysophospholipase L1-like esterase